MRFFNVFSVLSILLICFVAVIYAEEDGESRVNLNSALEESEVLKMLRDQAAQQDKKLEELTRRLNKELHSMEQHFTEMFDKIKQTEDTLESNLKEVEEKVLGKVQKLDESNANAASGWIMPFIFLVVLVCAAGGFFVYMYQKATKHTHML